MGERIDTVKRGSVVAVIAAAGLLAVPFIAKGLLFAAEHSPKPDDGPKRDPLPAATTIAPKAPEAAPPAPANSAAKPGEFVCRLVVEGRRGHHTVVAKVTPPPPKDSSFLEYRAQFSGEGDPAWIRTPGLEADLGGNPRYLEWAQGQVIVVDPQGGQLVTPCGRVDR